MGGKVGGGSSRGGSGGGTTASFSSSRGGGGGEGLTGGGGGNVESELTLAGTQGVCVRAVFGAGETRQDTMSKSHTAQRSLQL